MTATLAPTSYYYPEYNPYMQLRGLNQLIKTLMQKSSENSTDIQLAVHTEGYSGPRGDNEYPDDCDFSNYFNAFMSSSIAAALAQFLESLIKNETLVIKASRADKAKILEHIRTKNISNNNGFWDVSKYWCTDSNRIENGIATGTIQLFDALNLGLQLPNNFDNYIKILFFYRNYVMHNGVEWGKLHRDKFKRRIAKSDCKGFGWSQSESVDKVCYLKDDYLKELLVFCKDLYQVFYPNQI